MRSAALYGIGKSAATISRAVERGWVVLQGVGGKPLDRRAGRNETLDVYPNRPAPVVVEQDGQRIVRQDMLWGLPPFRQGAGYGTNFRSLKNHLWRGKG